MEAKPAQQNIQDSFLTTRARNGTTLHLPGQWREAHGRIRSFDKYSVVLETSNQEQLILSMRFRRWSSRAVAIFTPSKAVAAHAEAEIPNAASGTEDEVSWLAPR